jgi:hypothetical protein
MPVPGYDPEDLDRLLLDRLDDEPERVLDAEQLRRYESGEDLVDVLSDEEIRDIVDEGSKS